jgi:hypothetical protein
MMNTFIIFDNGGKTPDRFTIINRETGDVFGAGEDPAAPNGVGKYCGNCIDHLIILHGAGWRQKLPPKKSIRAEADNYINNARLDPDWIGREITLNGLPENVRHFISHLDLRTRAGSDSKDVYTTLSAGKGVMQRLPPHHLKSNHSVPLTIP